MHAPPNPEMRSPVTCQSDRAKSQLEDSLSTRDIATAPIDLQSRKLRRLFFFRQDTPRTIASLAFAGCTR